MKFTLSWLKEHLETDAALDDILYHLTDLGLEVEEVSNPAERLADFTIGHVVSADKHPDADKLRVCQVETDEGVKQIICGAPNARAGINVVIAKPGTYVPGIDTTIQIGKIRGVESHGMMCSEREMELSDEHDGIIELEGGEVGERFTDYLAANDPSKTDPVIEIAITPNRPDALGVHGVARDLAAKGIGTLKAIKSEAIKGAFLSPIKVSIDKDALDAAPVFYGRMIRNVKNAPSPAWLQDRLRAIGLRPISALVDVTNYFTFAYNRPLHVFDADKVKGDLRVHAAKGGEKLIGLDEKEYEFEAGMTLISDDAGVQSIAGVMGGLETGCAEDTVNVFLEAAYFDPIRTAITGRKLKINSDARYRFERGIDPEFTSQGFEMATQMILDLCGGEASEMVIAGEIPDTKRDYHFDPERVQSLVGMKIEAGEQKQILEALGFELKGDRASPPSWRPDVLGDADLVEEIVRVKSLNDLKGEPMSRRQHGALRPVLTLRQRREALIRRMLAARGMNECVTYSFIDEKAAKAFGGGSDAVRLANPISQDMSHMRPNLYAGLVQAASRNMARGFGDLALFELGQGFAAGEPEDQFSLVSGILVGSNVARNAYGTRRAVDVFDAKEILGDVLGALGHSIERLTLLKHDAAWFHPGRSAKLGLGPKNIIAEFGELHPKVTKALGVKGRVIALSIFHEKLPEPKSKSTARAALQLNDLQEVSRDFAFVVDAAVAADDLLKAVRAADKKLIGDAILFDVFEGAKAEEQLGAGKKSMAVSVRLVPLEKTLTDDDIKAVSDAIIARAAKAVGAELRG